MRVCPTCEKEAPKGATLCPTDGTPLPPDDGGRATSGTQLGATPVPLAPGTPSPRAATPPPVATGSEGARATAREPSARLKDYLSDEHGDLPVGTMVGEYEVTGKLGEGGMGQVYAAVHPIIGKKVAVKVLSEHVAANREVVRRFVAEARAVNQIGHRNIVDVFAFGQLEDGREYYVMEHLAGKSLEEELEERSKVPADEIVKIILPVLDALQAAHDKGITHRDLKPDNIFLVEDGRGKWRDVKLLDFGIAKLSGDDAGLTKTRTGVAMGTPDYMSPEQCLGTQVDHRTDIYAIGIILYRLVTGVFPYQGSSAVELLFKHVHEELPPPSAVVEMPGALEDVILKATAKAAAERYQSAGELAEALEAAIAEPGELRKSEAPAESKGSASAVHPVAGALATAADAVNVADLGNANAPAKGMQAAKLGGEPAARRNRTLGIAVAAAAVLVLGIVGLGVLKKGKSSAAAGLPDAGVAAATLVTSIDAAPPAPRIDAAVAPATGKLAITTNREDAIVFVNDEEVGQGTSVDLAGLVPGSYVVKVESPGYDTETLEVAVDAGRIASKAVELKKTKVATTPRTGGKTPKNGGEKSPNSGKDKQGGDKKPDPLKDKDGTINVFGD